MKKVILMVAVAFMTAMNVNAQNEDLRHELSLSYGFGSIAQFGDITGLTRTVLVFTLNLEQVLVS